MLRFNSHCNTTIPKGGEWRWHPPDTYHPKGHWDYNPWYQWNSPWRDVEPSVTLPVTQPSSTDLCAGNPYCT